MVNLDRKFRLYFVPNHLAESELQRYKESDNGETVQILGRGGEDGEIVNFDVVDGKLKIYQEEEISDNGDKPMQKAIRPWEAGIILISNSENE